MEQTDKIALRNVILAVVFAVALSRLSIASLVMTVPVLFACYQWRDTSKALVPFGILLLVVTVWTLVQNRMVFGTEYQGLLAAGLFPPVAAIIGSAVWLYVRDRSSSLLRKLFWACMPVYVISIALAMYFASSASESVRSILAESVLYYFPEEVLSSLSVDIAAIARTSVDMLAMVYAPMGVILVGLPVMICDTSIHKYDDQWQNDFANMKFPDSYVWVFLSTLALMLLCRWVGFPVWVKALIVNTALFMGLLYFVVGASILLALARKKSPAIRAGRIMFTLVLMCFIPGLNALVLVGLPILGVLETWVNFR